MPKYMVVLSYSAEGFKALEKSTARGRREWIGAALERVGGKLESLYFTADEADLISSDWRSRTVHKQRRTPIGKARW